MPDQPAGEVVDADDRQVGADRAHPGVTAVVVEPVGDLEAGHPDRLEAEGLGLGHGDRRHGRHRLVAVRPSVEGEEHGEGEKNEQNGHFGPPSFKSCAGRESKVDADFVTSANKPK